MTGILVHGSNHFIVRGPLPDRATSLALAKHWSLIQIALAQDGPEVPAPCKRGRSSRASSAKTSRGRSSSPVMAKSHPPCGSCSANYRPAAS